MSMLNKILDLVKEEKEPKTPEEYEEYIRYNKFKNKLISGGHISIGSEKIFYGPFEDRPKQMIIPQEIPNYIKYPELETKKNNINIQNTASLRNNEITAEEETGTKDGLALFKLPNGMKNAMNGGYTCINCGFPIPRYKGRYPNKCPSCDENLEMKLLENKNILENVDNLVEELKSLTDFSKGAATNTAIGIIVNMTEMGIIRNIISYTVGSRSSPGISKLISDFGVKADSFDKIKKLEVQLIRDSTKAEDIYKEDKDKFKYLESTDQSISTFIINSFEPLLKDFYLFLDSFNKKVRPKFNSLDDLIKWCNILRFNIGTNKIDFEIKSVDKDVNARLFSLSASKKIRSLFRGNLPVEGKLLGHRMWHLMITYQLLINKWRKNNKKNADTLERKLDEIIGKLN